MEPLTRRERLFLGGAVALAFAIRVAFILSKRGDVLFDHPMLDEERYLEVARSLAAGGAGEDRPWYQPPGVAYALAAVLRIAGPGLLAPRIVQAAVSSASCFVAFAVARRIFSKRVALATAAICALHGVLVFESYELLPSTWLLAASLSSVWASLVARDRGTPLAALVAGIATGVAAVFGPTVLPFAAIVAAWLRRAPLVAAFAGGLALAIAPVTLRNARVGHETVLVSTNGGINFFLGNNADYAKTFALRPGARWDELTEEPRRAGVTTWSGYSSYFFAKGLAFYREHPGSAAALYLRKLYLYFTAWEIPRDTDVHAARAPLVVRGPPALPDGLLVPLAIVGAALCLRDRRKLFLAYAFVAVQAIVLAAFFVTSRHRVPALPFFAMFAAAGVARVIAAPRVATLAATAAAIAAVHVPLWETKLSFAAEAEFFRGLAHARATREPLLAIDDFRRAAALDPRDARFPLELGNALADARRTDEAIAEWRKAAELDPRESSAWRRAAQALAQRGDDAAAIDVLERAIGSHVLPPSSYVPDRVNLAFLQIRARRYGDAIAQLRAASAADPATARGAVARTARAVLEGPPIDDAAFWSGLAGVCDALRIPDLASASRSRAGGG